MYIFVSQDLIYLFSNKLILIVHRFFILFSIKLYSKREPLNSACIKFLYRREQSFLEILTGSLNINPFDRRAWTLDIPRNMAARADAPLQLECTSLKLFTLVPGVARSRKGGATAPASAVAGGVDARIKQQIGIRGGWLNSPWRSECVRELKATAYSFHHD